MPTKKKRLGFIPREDVMKIIDKLSVENNLSYSKIISILVEEALSVRGIFNNKTGKATQSYIDNNISELLNEKYDDFKGNDKITINTKVQKRRKSNKTNLFRQTNHQTFDLQSYEMFLSFLNFREMMEKYDD